MINTIREIIRLYRKLKLRYGSQRTVIKTLRKMGVRIGKDCRIYTANFGSEPWLIRIGDNVCISNDVTFVNHNLNWSLQHKHESLTGFDKIEVLDNSQIGIGVTVLPGVTIGPNAMIGACSVVTKSIPPDTVAAGNPVKVICTLDEFEERCIAGHIDIPNNRSQARKVLERHFWGETG